MKAIVKATGEIKEVSRGIYSPYQYVDKEGTIYTENDVEELSEGGGVILDYWTRLEHQAAIGAMQGLLSSGKLNIIIDNSDVLPEGIAITSRDFAHALVEKLKNSNIEKEQ